MNLPSLENLAYPVDGGEHPEGGHCAALGGGSPEDDRIAMVEQYATALRVLVDDAVASGDRWSLSRPILFVAHQLCENALDEALARMNIKVNTSGNKSHDLTVRMEAALQGGAYSHRSDEEREWCQQFIEKVAPITAKGFPGRYAQARVSGKDQLDDVWCCIDLTAIRDAAITFAALTVVGLGDAWLIDQRSAAEPTT